MHLVMCHLTIFVLCVSERTAPNELRISSPDVVRFRSFATDRWVLYFCHTVSAAFNSVRAIYRVIIRLTSLVN